MTEYGKIHTDGSRSGGQPLDDSIEEKALALVKDCGGDVLVVVRNGNAWVEALCRAIEQHEAFKQEVSDALVDYFGEHLVAEDGGDALASFVIPKPKPDPLAFVLDAIDVNQDLVSPQEYAEKFRAALEARGLEIREKGQ